MGNHDAGPRRRAGRPGAADDSLSRAHILETALHLVDQHGVQGLSMRRLAAVLGVTPMSLYHHVPGKAALIAGVIDAVFSELQPSAPAGSTWQEQVHTWAVAYARLARSHPNLVLLIISNAAAASDATLSSSEPLYRALVQAGLSVPAIVVAVDTIVDFVHGSVLAMASVPTDHRALEREFLDRIEAQPPGTLPAMRRVVEAMVQHSEPGFSRGIEPGISLVIKGIEALVVEHRSANTRG